MGTLSSFHHAIIHRAMAALLQKQCQETAIEKSASHSEPHAFPAAMHAQRHPR
jgi:hypothetical protein